jgi:hypothetical protein
MRFVMLLLFLLLTSAAPAYAECAWVLWGTAQDNQHVLTSERYIAAVYDTQLKCELAAESLARALPRPKHWSADAPMGGYVQCLPDTLDPRGPKGK